jgi:hypothetical protein
MPIAIFGISNNGLNLAVSLFALMLVVVWLALIAYTYLDARRRISDPVLVACATAASLFPYIGTIVYVIVRPPEFIEDAHERELEMKASALRVRQLAELSCPNCEYPVEKNFLRCPNCQRRLKDPCQTCGKPVDPRWALCPYCESALPARARQQRPAEQSRGGAPSRAGEPAERSERAQDRPEPKPKRRAKRRKEPAAPEAEAGADSVSESPKAKEPRPPSRRSKSQSGASRQPRERNPSTRQTAPVPDSGTDEGAAGGGDAPKS